MDVTENKEYSDYDIARPHKRVNIINSDPCSSDESDSDISSDDDAEKCPICLLTFRTQEVGSPESCDHQFCLKCIKEWSKNINTCPVDRQSFNQILVRDSYNGKIVNQVPAGQCNTKPAEQPNAQPLANDYETNIIDLLLAFRQDLIHGLLMNANDFIYNDEDQTNDSPNIPSSSTTERPTRPATYTNTRKSKKKRKTRNLVGSPPLHIFGPKVGFDFSPDESSEHEYNARKVIKSRAPTSHDALIYQNSINNNKKAKIARSLDMPSTSTSSCDIIGNILESQEKLYSKQFKQSLKNDGTIAYRQALSQNVSTSTSAQDLSDMYKHSNNYVKNTNLVDDLCVNSTTNENLSVKTDLHTTDDNLSSEKKNNNAESVYSPLEEPNKSPIPIIKEACTSNSNKSAKSKVKDRLDALFGPDSPTDAHNGGSKDSSNTNNKVLKKLKMQEYVATIVKSCLKPYYVNMCITKDEYKDILRRAVPKICHSVVGKVYKEKVRQLTEAYVRKIRSNQRLAG